MRKAAFLTLVMLLALTSLLAPQVAGAGVNVLEVTDGYDKEVTATEWVNFTWVVFNNDTMPYLVQVTAEEGTTSNGHLPQDVGVMVNQDFDQLSPGESRQIILNVTADRTVDSMVFPVFVNMTFTPMNQPGQGYSESRVAQVQVKAMYESTGNKIFGVWTNTLPSPFNTLVWSFILTVLIYVGIAAAVYFLVDPLIRHFTRKTKMELDDRLLEATRIPIFGLIVSFGFVDSLAILEIPQDLHYTIMKAYEVAVVIILAYTAYRIFDRVVIYYAEKWSSKTDTEIDDVLVPLLHKVGIILIPIVGIITVMSVLGINVTLLVAGMGVIGLVVAFAVQETLGNLFAGMQLLADRPFKVGDIVELDSGEICEVRRIGLRSTTMYNTADHEIIVVPNNDVVNKKVINFSRPDHHRSMSCEVGVAYGTDLKKAQSILMEVAMGHPEVIKQEGQMPYIRVSNLNESSVDLKLWYWVDIKGMWRVASEIRQAVYERFNHEGIEIPFPQSVVTFKNQPPSP
jgi:MscS family membrane protein